VRHVGPTRWYPSVVLLRIGNRRSSRTGYSGCRLILAAHVQKKCVTDDANGRHSPRQYCSGLGAGKYRVGHCAHTIWFPLPGSSVTHCLLGSCGLPRSLLTNSVKIHDRITKCPPHRRFTTTRGHFQTSLPSVFPKDHMTSCLCVAKIVIGCRLLGVLRDSIHVADCSITHAQPALRNAWIMGRPFAKTENNWKKPHARGK
jgi:hypothetical protein